MTSSIAKRKKLISFARIVDSNVVEIYSFDSEKKSTAGEFFIPWLGISSTQPSILQKMAKNHQQNLKNHQNQQQKELEEFKKLTSNLAEGLKSLNSHLDGLKQLDKEIQKLDGKNKKKK